MGKSLHQYMRDRRNNKYLNQYRNMIKEMAQFDYKNSSDIELRCKFREFREAADSGVHLDELLIEVFALVKEAVFRMLGLITYDEQLLAGIALHHGKLVEMQTGEGKTLAAVFPACLNALAGLGVHILTFNDYLARRDATWMDPVYSFLGISVGFIQEEMSFSERKTAYACDVTYMTAKEAGFDYLRDSLSYSREELRQRGLHYTIIDEADSILIDEARIPLVVAASVIEENQGAAQAMKIFNQLEASVHYELNENRTAAFFTYEGIEVMEEKLQCENLYDDENLPMLAELNCALYAAIVLQKDIDYIIRNGKVEMVDEFTGRVAENRHWPDGIQAAIEVKEGLALQSKGRILNRITLQSYIGRYKKIAGMTGSALESSEEFEEFYGVEVLPVPTHKPVIRKDTADLVFTHKEAKYSAIIKEIVEVHHSGQPILVGTSSVKESMYLASKLREIGITCRVLNAKNDEQEAQLIAEAGALNKITVSTNMAGRGTDIRLGGVEEKDRDKVLAVGGLYVIGTNRYESRRINRQLRGRSGRQGEPGVTKFFISLEDDLMIKHGINEALPPSLKNMKQDKPIPGTYIVKKIEHMQKVIEGKYFDVRRSLWRFAYILEKQREEVRKRRIMILEENGAYQFVCDNLPNFADILKKPCENCDFNHILQQVILYHIDENWSEYLIKIESIREGIHLNLLGGKNPLEVFQFEISSLYRELQEDILKSIAAELISLIKGEESMTDLYERCKPPSSTWTYLIQDQALEENLGMMLLGNRNVAITAAGGLAIGIAIAIDYLNQKLQKFTQKGS